MLAGEARTADQVSNLATVEKSFVTKLEGAMQCKSMVSGDGVSIGSSSALVRALNRGASAALPVLRGKEASHAVFQKLEYKAGQKALDDYKEFLRDVKIIFMMTWMFTDAQISQVAFPSKFDL